MISKVLDVRPTNLDQRSSISAFGRRQQKAAAGAPWSYDDATAVPAGITSCWQVQKGRAGRALT